MRNQKKITQSILILTTPIKYAQKIVFIIWYARAFEKRKKLTNHCVNNCLSFDEGGFIIKQIFIIRSFQIGINYGMRR